MFRKIFITFVVMALILAVASVSVTVKGTDPGGDGGDGKP